MQGEKQNPRDVESRGSCAAGLIDTPTTDILPQALASVKKKNSLAPQGRTVLHSGMDNPIHDLTYVFHQAAWLASRVENLRARTDDDDIRDSLDWAIVKLERTCNQANSRIAVLLNEAPP